MCGICGASFAEQDRPKSLERVAREMLLGIEERGRHATGLAWDHDGDVWIDKAPLAASKFVSSMPSMGDASVFLGHTRWASQGSPSNPLNNHPIEASGLVGIHNGVVHNDDDLFELLPFGVRRGEVDSEAIFAFVGLSGLEVPEALTWVKGSAAVAWIDSQQPTILHLARISSSPLVIARSKRGSLYFASTQTCLQRLRNLGISLVESTSVDEGTYLAIQNGNIVDSQRFTVSGRAGLTDVERRALNLAPQR